MDSTDDLTPMEQELVAQARRITDAKYEMYEQDFADGVNGAELARRWKALYRSLSTCGDAG